MFTFLGIPSSFEEIHKRKSKNVDRISRTWFTETISENQVDNDQIQHQITSLKQPFVSGPRKMSQDGKATNALKVKLIQICSPKVVHIVEDALGISLNKY